MQGKVTSPRQAPKPTRTPPLATWRCLDDARRRKIRRVPFVVDGHLVGSVARAHLGALADWGRWLRVDASGVALIAPHRSRSVALARINAGLRDLGCIAGWRDERFAIVRAPGESALARIERASARFWGTLTFAAHANGYVADTSGRPTHLWISRRSAHKATDPGKLDNLVAGGVPHGQTPWQTLLREGHEEAGLDLATMTRAQPGSVLALRCDVAEGFMHEHLHAYDLRLPHGLVPHNVDGEVQSIRKLKVRDAIDAAAAGDMTMDAALVTLDFALRHGLIDGSSARGLRARLRPHLLREPLLPRPSQAASMPKRRD